MTRTAASSPATMDNAKRYISSHCRTPCQRNKTDKTSTKGQPTNAQASKAASKQENASGLCSTPKLPRSHLEDRAAGSTSPHPSTKAAELLGRGKQVARFSSDLQRGLHTTTLYIDVHRPAAIKQSTAASNGRRSRRACPKERLKQDTKAGNPDNCGRVVGKEQRVRRARLLRVSARQGLREVGRVVFLGWPSSSCASRARFQCCNMLQPFLGNLSCAGSKEWQQSSAPEQPMQQAQSSRLGPGQHGQRLGQVQADGREPQRSHTEIELDDQMIL